MDETCPHFNLNLNYKGLPTTDGIKSTYQKTEVNDQPGTISLTCLKYDPPQIYMDRNYRYKSATQIS